MEEKALKDYIKQNITALQNAKTATEINGYANIFVLMFQENEALKAENERLTKEKTELRESYDWSNKCCEEYRLKSESRYRANLKLRKENAELRARLEKAVELPKFLYGVPPSFGIKNEIDVIQITEYDGKIEDKKEVYIYPEDIGKYVFLTREAAEARLKKLEGK